MKWSVVALAAFAILAAYIRFAPSDAAVWHVDPRTAPDPGPGGVKREVSLPMSPAMADGQLEALARSEPRAQLLHTEGLSQTWIFRSRLMGYPDYVTWAVDPDGDGARVTILSRLRFGKADLGVNAKRIDGWLKVLTGQATGA